MGDIANRLAEVNARIDEAMERFQRPAGDVQLIAVSKTKPVAAIIEAYHAGQRVFGESYVQEAIEKIEQIDFDDIEWHFIGPIQSNKTRQIASHFNWVHSIDRIKIAQRLHEQRPVEQGLLNVCIQVNISGEDSKSGVSVADIDGLLEGLVELKNLRLRGLMAIPQQETVFERQRENFAQLSQALQRLNTKYQLSMDTLSMGMSQDLEAAIAEGSTMVRVGTDIFGARDYPQTK